MIQVTLEMAGNLQEPFGQAVYQVELPDGANLGDLLVRIEAYLGGRPVGSIWNWTEHRFRGAVVLMIGSRAVKDRATLLRDGQVVKAFKAVVGG